MSNDRQNHLGLRGNYQWVSSNHHAVNAIDDPAAIAAEFQRRWVPPQLPGVIMPEAATAIRQPTRSVPRQQPQAADAPPSTDVPRPSELAVASSEVMSDVPGATRGELASNGGGAVTAGASSSAASEEQQQQQEAA
jgi:peroxin-14